jgi:hypothetical protein
VDITIAAPTEIYLPALHFPPGFRLELGGCGSLGAITQIEGQVLRIRHAHAGSCSVTVSGRIDEK